MNGKRGLAREDLIQSKYSSHCQRWYKLPTRLSWHCMYTQDCIIIRVWMLNVHYGRVLVWLQKIGFWVVDIPCRKLVQLSVHIWHAFKMNLFVWCLHCQYRKGKTWNAFLSIIHFFYLKVMFRYHFLGHFSADLNEICCVAMHHCWIVFWQHTQGYFLKQYETFSPQKIWNGVKCLCFSYTKWLKMYYSIKLKHSFMFLHLYVFYVRATFH